MSTARTLSGQAMFRYDSPRSTCWNCGDRIAKISKYDSPANPWLHEHNYTAKCPSGGTVAMPTPSSTFCFAGLTESADEDFPLEDLLAIENQIDQGRYQ